MIFSRFSRDRIYVNASHVSLQLNFSVHVISDVTKFLLDVVESFPETSRHWLNFTPYIVTTDREIVAVSIAKSLHLVLRTYCISYTGKSRGNYSLNLNNFETNNEIGVFFDRFIFVFS